MATKTKPKSDKSGNKSSALHKEVEISEVLEAVVGKGPMSRATISKKMWNYIKQHQCQDPKNRRMIKPDDKLSKLFGTSELVDMFKMNAYVASHVKG